jgi:hypothetical protein
MSLLTDQQKKKLFEILLTALLSALLAFLQNLISGISQEPILQNTPVVAGAVGATLSFFRNIKSC